jgi:single-strand DNA-binding protein
LLHQITHKLLTLKKPIIMKNLRNKVQLIGNLGMDPEVKQFESGKSVARLSLATKENFRNAAGEKTSETQWHTLVAWGKSAEFASTYLKKGSEVAVEGKLVSRSYNDKEGNKRYVTEVVVDEFLMLGSRK